MRQPSLFALGAGGFVAGTVGTLLVLVAPKHRLVVAGVAAAISLTVTAAAATHLSTPARVERFRSLYAGTLVVVVPVASTAAVVTRHYGLLGPSQDVFWPGMVSIGVAGLGGVSMLHAAERRYAARVEAESDVYVTLPDPSGEEPGRRWQIASALVALAAVALFLGSAVLSDGLDPTMVFVVLGGLTPLLTAQNRSELIVLDAGLKQGVSIRPWSDFESYEMTDDELVIRDGSWFPKQYAIPGEKIDDEDAVVATLSRYLPEERTRDGQSG